MSNWRVMPSPNPGISAAGEAAGRTALNPSAGPAAIGGMLVPGEEPEVETSGQTEMQTRLSTAVSDIAKLANAMEALSVGRYRVASPAEERVTVPHGAADDPPPTSGVDAARGDGGAGRVVGFGSVNGEASNPSGFAARSGAPVETNRQVASHYRL
jgi:hypothetical protein